MEMSVDVVVLYTCAFVVNTANNIRMSSFNGLQYVAVDVVDGGLDDRRHHGPDQVASDEHLNGPLSCPHS